MKSEHPSNIMFARSHTIDIFDQGVSDKSTSNCKFSRQRPKVNYKPGQNTMLTVKSDPQKSLEFVQLVAAVNAAASVDDDHVTSQQPVSNGQRNGQVLSESRTNTERWSPSHLLSCKRQRKILPHRTDQHYNLQGSSTCMTQQFNKPTVQNITFPKHLHRQLHQEGEVLMAHDVSLIGSYTNGKYMIDGETDVSNAMINKVLVNNWVLGKCLLIPDKRPNKHSTNFTPVLNKCKDITKKSERNKVTVQGTDAHALRVVWDKHLVNDSTNISHIVSTMNTINEMENMKHFSTGATSNQVVGSLTVDQVSGAVSGDVDDRKTSLDGHKRFNKPTGDGKWTSENRTSDSTSGNTSHHLKRYYGDADCVEERRRKNLGDGRSDLNEENTNRKTTPIISGSLFHRRPTVSSQTSPKENMNVRIFNKEDSTQPDSKDVEDTMVAQARLEMETRCVLPNEGPEPWSERITKYLGILEQQQKLLRVAVITGTETAQDSDRQDQLDQAHQVENDNAISSLLRHRKFFDLDELNGLDRMGYLRLDSRIKTKSRKIYSLGDPRESWNKKLKKFLNIDRKFIKPVEDIEKREAVLETSGPLISAMTKVQMRRDQSSNEKLIENKCEFDDQIESEVVGERNMAANVDEREKLRSEDSNWFLSKESSETVQKKVLDMYFYWILRSFGCDGAGLSDIMFSGRTGGRDDFCNDRTDVGDEFSSVTVNTAEHIADLRRFKYYSRIDIPTQLYVDGKSEGPLDVGCIKLTRGKYWDSASNNHPLRVCRGVFEKWQCNEGERSPALPLKYVDKISVPSCMNYATILKHLECMCQQTLIAHFMDPTHNSTHSANFALTYFLGILNENLRKRSTWCHPYKPHVDNMVIRGVQLKRPQ